MHGSCLCLRCDLRFNSHGRPWAGSPSSEVTCGHLVSMQEQGTIRFFDRKVGVIHAV